jgi:hypothetical protein
MLSEWGSEMSKRTIETFVIRPACSLTFTCSSPYWKLTASPTAERDPESVELVVVVEVLVVWAFVVLAVAVLAVAVEPVVAAGAEARLAPVEGVAAW